MATRIFSIAAIIIALLLSACGGNEAVTSETDVTSTHVLQEFLQARGATENKGSVTQPFFSVNGTILVHRNAAIQVFEYSSSADASAEAENIAPDGTSVGETQLSWMEPPHFYLSGTLIVLYVGNDQSITSLLEEALGEQIAGQ